jgi:uncharacterized membrane protein YkoI
MTQRSILVVYLVLGTVLASASPTFSKANDHGAPSGNNGKGNDNGKGNGAGNGNSNGNGAGNSNGNGKASGNGATGTGGNSQGQSTGGKDKSKGTKASPAVVLDDRASLAAVTAGKAISLEKILVAARGRVHGKIINVRLLNRGGALVYEVKGLSPSGVVVNHYFQAKSGRPVAN